MFQNVAYVLQLLFTELNACLVIFSRFYTYCLDTLHQHPLPQILDNHIPFNRNAKFLSEYKLIVYLNCRFIMLCENCLTNAIFTNFNHCNLTQFNQYSPKACLVFQVARAQKF